MLRRHVTGNEESKAMTNFLKDLYSIAYQFARRLSPKRSTDSAADYAKRICILWLILGLLFVMTFVDVVLRMHVRNLLGRNRLELVVFSVTAVVAGYAVVGLWLRRIPELQTPETIERHYEQLPALHTFADRSSAVPRLVWRNLIRP